MKKYPILIKIWHALAVAIFGFVLLNIVFILDSLLTQLISRIISLFTSFVPESFRWFPPLSQVIFVIIIAISSFYIFRSKLSDVLKCIFLTVPLVIFYVAIGIIFFTIPIVGYAIATLLTISLLYFFFYKKLSWIYFYTVILVALTLMTFTVVGGQIWLNVLLVHLHRNDIFNIDI